MKFVLGPREVIARAANELRLGLPLIIKCGDQQILALSAETADDERIGMMLAEPQAKLAVTARRAQTLKARIYDGDIARIRIPDHAAADWVRATADPSKDLEHPLSGPHMAVRDGAATPFRVAVKLARRARVLPAILGAPVKESQLAVSGDKLMLFDADATPMTEIMANEFSLVSQAGLPLPGARDARIYVYRANDGSADHCVIEFGQASRSAPVLLRLHSQCFTGDVLGSLKCDCGAQLASALDLLRDAGSGLLIYLEHEGRGIGIANKIRAYSLQDQGFDTVESNHRLGYEDDERDFRAAAEILGDLGFCSVRLMTNNPRKISMLEANGITVVDRVPLIVGRNETNACYLETKAEKSGHML